MTGDETRREIIDAAIASGHLIIAHAPAPDPGAPCVSCGRDTSPGTGRFVNRVPADGGYMCEPCHTPAAYETPAGPVCADCGDGDELGPDCVPVYEDEFADGSAAIPAAFTCSACGSYIWCPYDPAGMD